MKTMFRILGIAVLFALVFTACSSEDNAGLQIPTEKDKEKIIDKLEGASVAMPTQASKTHNSITINAVSAPSNGQAVEYSINTTNSASASWQDGLTFSGLASTTTYYIFARSKANDIHNAGMPSEGLEVTTDNDPNKEAGAEVATPTQASKTHNSITINAVTAPGNGQTVEYGRNTSNSAPTSWQDGLTFSGLTPNTTYYIFARSKANDTHNAGTPSAGLEIVTNQDNTPVVWQDIEFNASSIDFSNQQASFTSLKNKLSSQSYNLSNKYAELSSSSGFAQDATNILASTSTYINAAPNASGINSTHNSTTTALINAIGHIIGDTTALRTQIEAFQAAHVILQGVNNPVLYDNSSYLNELLTAFNTAYAHLGVSSDNIPAAIATLETLLRDTLSGANIPLHNDLIKQWEDFAQFKGFAAELNLAGWTTQFAKLRRSDIQTANGLHNSPELLYRKEEQTAIA